MAARVRRKKKSPHTHLDTPAQDFSFGPGREVPAGDIALAQEIVSDPAFSASESVKKLGLLLEKAPDRAIPLILGLETPAGRPTLEAILIARKDRADELRKKDTSEASPYSEVDRPGFTGVSVEEVRQNSTLRVPSEEVKNYEIRFESLNPLQSAIFPFVDRDCNLVISGSTSCGKTLAAELCLNDATERLGKGVFLNPLKAVSQEKHQDWTSSSHPWSDKEVVIATGDYDMTEAKRQALDRCDIAVLTSEMLDSASRRMGRNKNRYLTETLVLAVDEAHLLTMEGRGDALEAGLMRFTHRNPKARIVLLSATMPNVEQLGEWLTSLNGKPTLVVNCSWRPTELGVWWLKYKKWNQYQSTEKSKRDRARQILKEYPNDKFIVFVHAKKAGHALLEELQREDGEVAEFHSADLGRDARLALEDRFRSGDLRVLIATSTLSWGINAPARRVIVLGVHRGMDLVDPIDVKQMVGRSGRVGLDPRGDAYVLLPHNDYGNMRERFSVIRPITSCLADEHALAFHLTAEIADGDVRTVSDAETWFRRSLAHMQGIQCEDLESLLLSLTKSGILTLEDGEYTATMLGRVSSWLYFSPFDIADWCGNFRAVMRVDKTRSDALVAWALGTVKTSWSQHLPRDAQLDHGRLAESVRDTLGEPRSVSPSAVAVGQLMRGFRKGPLVSVQRSVQRDIDRICQALKLIDKHVLKGFGDHYWDLVATRVKNGCSWTAAELCSIPGIGSKRAEALIESGITSVKQAARSKSLLISTLGPTRGLKAYEAALAMQEG